MMGRLKPAFGILGSVNRHAQRRIFAALFCLITLQMLAQAPPSANSLATPTPRIRWAGIPLSFEPNLGQEPPEVRYLARSNSYTLYLGSGEMLLSGSDRASLRMKLLGANRTARVTGEGQQDSTSNYFVGNDPSRWRTSVPNYERARYRQVYPGIDLVYYGHQGTLEYDWIVSPGADPQAIRLSFAGADQVRVDKAGDLVVKLGKSEYRHKRPIVYQEVAGKRIEIAGKWISRGKEAGFRIGGYDRGLALVIDPVLFYATYLGGNGLDYAYAIAVDKAGNTYVTGGTGSTNFPTSGQTGSPLQSSLKGAEDVFVTKINATGTAKIYSTYLGGGGPDEGKGIAVNGKGEAYVTGNAGSFDFPMMNAIQGTWGGSGDAFLTKLNAKGTGLVYSTYLGGNAIDYATAVALDPAGNAYIVGVTFSSNFPTVNPYQAAKGAQQDAFVAKINPTGTAWVYATYLGGNNVDEGYAIATDASGNAYVTGYTASTNFPMQSAYRGSNGATVDAFVTKINPAGSALVYSTYLGGGGTDYGTGIAVDSSGNAYVTGVTGSSDFPTVNAVQLHLAGGDDAFVTKFDPSGASLVYSTYVGGGSVDQPYALAVDQSGNAWITGRTNSSDFPLTNAIQGTRFAFDMFITEISADGSARLFSTFLGGTGSESGRGIAVDYLGDVHIAGEGTSTDFPVVNALQPSNGGGTGSQDGIVVFLGSRRPYMFNDFSGKGCSDGALIYSASTGQTYTGLSNNDGTYSYVPSALTPGFNILRTGDFNGDGKADLVVYNSQTALAYIGLGDGAGAFNFQSLFWSPGYDFVEVGDINGDGKSDVVLYNSSTGTMYTAISNGDGTFAYQYVLAVSGFTIVRLADFTGDGKADVLLYRGSDGLFSPGVSDGTGVFTFKGMPPIAAGYNLDDVGDLNGEGEADLLLYNSANGNAVTGISDGAGGFTFTTQTFSPGLTSVRLADYTGDGNADVSVYNKNTASASIGIGTGTGTFNFQQLFWSPGYDYAIPEDVNCDGKTDVILYNSSNGTEYTGISSGDGTFSYTYSYWGAGNVIVDQDNLSAVTPHISLSTASIDFGSVWAHTANMQSVTIANIGLGILHISSASSDSTQVSVDASACSAVNPGGTCSLGISFAPVAAGNLSAAVHISSDAPESPTTTVSVSAVVTDVAVNLSRPSRPSRSATLLAQSFSIPVLISSRIVAEQAAAAFWSMLPMPIPLPPATADDPKARKLPAAESGDPGRVRQTDASTRLVTGSATSSHSAITLEEDTVESAVGVEVTFTAFVSVGDQPGRGEVTFSIAGKEVKKARLDDKGHATFVTSALPAGRSSVKALFVRDKQTVAESLPVIHTVRPRE